MLQINRISLKSKLYLMILFFTALIYMFLITNGVSFFWDNHEFHTGYVQTKSIEIIKVAIQETGTTSNTARPIFALIFKALYGIFGFNLAVFRLFMSFFFALTSAIFGYLCLKFMGDKKYIFLIPLFVSFIFPIFIHVLTYNPWVITNLFAIIIILLFLIDYKREKTSFLTQASILILCWLSFKMYSPSKIIIGPLILFILFDNRTKYRRYWLLLITIFLISFPIIPFLKSGELPISSLPFGVNFLGFKDFFLNANSINYMLSPFPNLQVMYYLPLISIIGFFGFWLLILSLGLWILYKLRYPKIFDFSEDRIFRYKTFMKFAMIWLICESTIWLALPEIAIRYASGSMFPFAIISGILILNTRNILKHRYKKIFSIIALSCIFLAVFTNLGYVAAFRATWGSSFIAFEKTTEYLEQTKKINASVLYFSGSAASEYLPLIDYSGKDYKINYESQKNYKKENYPEKFAEEEIKKLQKEFQEVYVLQRITSFSKNSLPNIDFEKYNKLKLINTIEGKENVLFDRVLNFFVDLFKVNYQPNKVLIYKAI